MSFAVHKSRRGGARPTILSIGYHSSWQGDSGGGNPYVFSNRGIGSAPAAGTRRFVVGIGHVVRSGAVDITGIKINGVTATTLLNVEQGNTAALRIAMREVTGGTTADLQIDLSNSASFGSGAFLSIITNGAGLTLIETDSDDTDPFSLDFTGQVGDAVIAASTLQSAGPHSWSGVADMSERYDGVVQSGYSSAYAGILTAEGADTVNCTVSGSPSTQISGLVMLRPGY